MPRIITGDDSVQLLELVEARPCLWDKACEDYKDKSAKKLAWREVYAFFISNYERLNEVEQKQMGDSITNRWHNMRDNFVRYLRMCPGTTRKYIHHDHMLFLMKNFNSEENEFSLKEENDDRSASFENQEHASVSGPSRRTTFSLRSAGGAVERPSSPPSNVSRDSNHSAKHVRKRPADQLEVEMLKVLKKMTEKTVGPDEDEAFFDSVLPTVRTMSAIDKIDFRVGVLGLMKSILNKS